MMRPRGGSGAVRRPGHAAPRTPVYLFPCRVQQGWGDVAEAAHAAWALHRAGFPLLHLDPTGSTGRRDPRLVPVHPRRAGPIRFPPVREVRRPRPEGKALVLATWWGLSARRTDAEGGPLPGPLEGAVGEIVRSHGASDVLHVSLEEFASDQSSREALDEGLRQAGWSRPARQRALVAPEGRRHRTAYHRAFVLARGGEREDVLHLLATFAPGSGALREFPFLLPVGPFGPSLLRKRPGRKRAAGMAEAIDRPRRILWYVNSSGAALMARRMVGALERLDRPLQLDIRGSVLPAERGGPGSPRNLVVRALGPLPPGAWARRWDASDLRIVGGSQSLVEAVRGDRPMLYHNGLVGGPPGSEGVSRGFRREKLLALLRAMRSPGTYRGSGRFTRDLLAFADGHDLEGVLGRALFSGGWRAEATRVLRSAAQVTTRCLPAGDRYLVGIAQAFAAHEGPVVTFVRTTRERHRRLARVDPPSWHGPGGPS